MFKKIYSVCLGSAVFLLPASAFAQQDSLQKIKEQELQPVEVRALRAGSNAPFAKSEISGREIQENNTGQDLPYLLQLTPSAVVSSDAGAGVGYTGLRIRGTDLGRTNVTLNGIPVNDAESQVCLFVNIPDLAASTSSVQIQRGVGTSSNGASAFGATLSISSLEQMEKAGAEAGFSAGSFNTQKYSVKAGTGLLSNGLQLDIRLSKITSDGYIDRSASDLKSLQLLAGWKISSKSSLKFMLMSGDQSTGQAWNGVPEDSLKANRRYNGLGLMGNGSYYGNQTDNYRQDYYQLFFNHRFRKELSLSLAAFMTRGKGYYEEYETDMKLSSYGLPAFITPSQDTFLRTDVIQQKWLDNYYYGSVFSLLYEKPKTQASFGGSFTKYDGDHYGFVNWAQYGVPQHYRWYLNDAHKTDFNLYAKAQHSIGNLILFGDIQFRNIHYKINGFRDHPELKPDVRYDFFNPKTGFSYLIKNTGSERQRVYVSFATASKEPNRDDFEASPVSLPRPERLYDWETGYEIQRLGWSAGANLYYMHYKDQLVLTGKINDVGAYTRTNVPESYRAGVELMAAAKPAYWISVNANAAFSKNKIKAFTEFRDNNDTEGQDKVQHENTDISFSPGFVSSAVVTITPFKNLSKGQGLSVDILNKGVGKQYLDNTSSESRSIRPYNITDLRLRYSIRLKPFKEVAATLAVNNIFNKMYESNGYTFGYISDKEYVFHNYYFPQAGTNWLLGLRLVW